MDSNVNRLADLIADFSEPCRNVFRLQVDYFVGIGKGFKSGAYMAGLTSRLPRTFLMWCSTTRVKSEEGDRLLFLDVGRTSAAWIAAKISSVASM